MSTISSTSSTLLAQSQQALYNLSQSLSNNSSSSGGVSNMLQAVEANDGETSGSSNLAAILLQMQQQNSLSAFASSDEAGAANTALSSSLSGQPDAALSAQGNLTPSNVMNLLQDGDVPVVD